MLAACMRLIPNAKAVLASGGKELKRRHLRRATGMIMVVGAVVGAAALTARPGL
jgi:hypothetical protein